MVVIREPMGIICSVDSLESNSDAEKTLPQVPKEPRSRTVNHPPSAFLSESLADAPLDRHIESGDNLAAKIMFNSAENSNQLEADHGNRLVNSQPDQWDLVNSQEAAALKRLNRPQPSKVNSIANRIAALFSKPKPKSSVLSKKRSGLRSHGRGSKEPQPQPAPTSGGPGDAAGFFDEAIASEAQVKTAEQYKSLRNDIRQAEAALAFDHVCTRKAKPSEVKANKKLQQLKQHDITNHYGSAKSRSGYHGQQHARFYGDHFLSNVDIIEQTQLFKICRAMPKGAHLHIHFNANLLPDFLLNIAKDQPHMYIWSNTRLVDSSGKVDATALDLCRIQFSILSPEAVEARGEGDIFHTDYKGGNGKEPQVMQFGKFREEFGKRHIKDTVDAWLQNKLLFQEDETYGLLQTAEGAWEKFNSRTQMMKGLFNYETAYKEYTKKCLEDFVDDNIQYVEIRPNFMSTNQVWADNGSKLIDNQGILDLIIKQYKKFQEIHKEEVIKGLKIIYCTPRSFDRGQVRDALIECLKFKLNEDYETYIAGFDLVGEESKGQPLKFFMEEFIQFKKACALAGKDIPFLFHCGETLDIGTDTDGNLVDALLLGSKRIGHGFALPRHPLIMEQMKKQGVCVEVCPISNEILGLTPRISGHSVYNLMANNVHCTVSTDNGTFFRSRLSHDFYQVMAGKSDMTLHGFRQLIEWSIEHSCMEVDLKQKVYKEWEVMWDRFCSRIVEGDFDPPAPSKSEGGNTSPVPPTV